MYLFAHTSGLLYQWKNKAKSMRFLTKENIPVKYESLQEEMKKLPEISLQ